MDLNQILVHLNILKLIYNYYITSNCKHSDEVYIFEDCDCLFCPAGKRDRGIELHTVE